ncbi:fluoride efflux transporter FluC [Nocardioides sp. GXQ0305]|uniref:fluoride efflux transporter FluC n=1 Tax=Nocardioides sp. GXQ0305 TaxID=3423912 RepID=UPI003D7EC672
MEPHELPLDPDAAAPPGTAHVLSAIAAGGALGSGGRELVERLVPVVGGFPWPTFLVNVTGALLIGVLMVVVTDVVTGRPLLRPFLGVGLLGGWTTFSTYAVEARELLAAGALPTASAYVLGSLVVGLLATWAGILATRRLAVGPDR